MKPSSYHAVYDAGVPPTLHPYPACTLLDVVRDTARERPNHPALLFKGARLSYHRLERLSDAFASALVAQGVHKGDRVALLMPKLSAVLSWCQCRVCNRVPG
jgi:long-chain acyl-CoA synthetase